MRARPIKPFSRHRQRGSGRPGRCPFYRNNREYSGHVRQSDFPYPHRGTSGRCRALDRNRGQPLDSGPVITGRLRWRGQVTSPFWFISSAANNSTSTKKYDNSTDNSTSKKIKIRVLNRDGSI